MSYIVRAAPPSHFNWLKLRTHCELTDGFRAIEALDEDGIVRGMVGYSGWTYNSVAMHVCIETPGALKALLRPAFEYPFVEGTKKLLLGITASDNKVALKFNKHVGFREVHRIKDGFADGVDLVVQEMWREECRWIR